MSGAEWGEWRARNPRSGLRERERAERPCHDCPLGYAAEMRAQGMCNGTPGGVDDEEEPMSQIQPLIAPAPVLRTETPVAVHAELPCGGCIHAPVCSIRPSLERLERLPLTMPAVDKAIGVELSATITCEYFLSLDAPRKRAGSAAGRKLNLSDEERDRRGQRLRDFNAARATPTVVPAE